MKRSEIRVYHVDIAIPDCAEPVIGRAFARPDDADPLAIRF
jgi:hypothetical protein